MFRILIIFYLCLNYVENATVINIEYDHWILQQYDLNEIEEISTAIPSGVCSTLMKHDVIQNTFLDYKYQQCTDMMKNKWKYENSFIANVKTLQASNIELVFHGIDGTGTIYLNNEKIGEVSNTFVRYRFDVTKTITTLNKIEIVFESPVQMVMELSKQFNSYTALNIFGVSNVHLLRRMQASFGTKWAPAVPSVGIWKDIELIAYENDAVIRDILVFTKPNFELWEIKATVIFDIPSSLNTRINNDETKNIPKNLGTLEAKITLDNNEVTSNQVTLTMNQNDSQTNAYLASNVSLKVLKGQVQQWWPNGYGSQHLYLLTVTYTNNNGVKTSKSIRIGFRTVKLIEENTHAGTFTFYFLINNVPIFAKGASFLPISILLEETFDEKKIDYLLKSAKMAHMNIIRVPANGIYQSDFFYQKCDEYGLLVWQEMMLDKKMYPFQNEKFARSLTKEITQQFMRLQYHPSLLIWVGNNEIQATISKQEDKIIRKKWSKEYIIFLNIVKNIFKHDNEFRPFLLSTPSNIFLQDPENSVITDDQNSYLSGDAHIDSKTSDSWLIKETDQVPKFVTEYLVWSLPSYQTLVDYSSNRHNDITSEIICSLSKHFGIPKDGYLDALIYASQINQAWSVKVQTENYRKWKSLISPENTGTTMGTVYWHLNDNWVAPSASSIEFNGKWKMLHYYAQKFFAPVASSIIEIPDFNQMSIFLISDLKEDINVYPKFEIFYWDSEKLEPFFTIQKPFILRKLSSKELFSVDYFMDILKEHCDIENISKKCLPKLTIYNENKKEINTNYLLPAVTSLRDIPIPNPNITVKLVSCNSEECKITVQTDAIALFVWLDVGNIGHFSDNGFIMTEPEKEVILYLDEEADTEKVSKLLDFKVLSKNYLTDNFTEPNNIKAC